MFSVPQKESTVKNPGYKLLNALVGVAIAILGGLGVYMRHLDQRIDAMGQNLGNRIDAVEQNLGTRIDAVERDLGDRLDAWARLFHKEQMETREKVAEPERPQGM